MVRELFGVNFIVLVTHLVVVMMMIWVPLSQMQRHGHGNYDHLALEMTKGKVML
jgi:hypothetical protein